MNSEQPVTDEKWGKAVAEAAAWVALLNGPGCTLAAKRGWHLWLNADERHRRAYKIASGIWNEYRSLATQRATSHPSSARDEVGYGNGRTFPKRWAVAAVVALSAICLMIGAYWNLRHQSVITEAGEHRSVVLEDRTVMQLSANGRVDLKFSARERRAYLRSGEAVFQVAKDRRRPFSVIAGSHKVTALGTSFHVLKSKSGVAVTLIEGHVFVAASDDADSSDKRPSNVYHLQPGERMTFTASARQPVVDRPSIDNLLDWTRGQIYLDAMPLVAAIEKVNRHSKTQLQLDSENSGDSLVYGSFTIGDSLSFAQAIAVAKGWRVEQRGDRIILRNPHNPGTPAGTASDRKAGSRI